MGTDTTSKGDREEIAKMININIVEDTKAILFKMVEEHSDIDVFREWQNYDESDPYYFPSFTYENFYKTIKNSLSEINSLVALYKKEKDNLDDRENPLTRLTAETESILRTAEALFNNLNCYVSDMEYLPFWSIIPKDYKIPKEYFTKLQGKNIVKHLYKEVFQSEEIFTYIQSELSQLFREKLNYNDSHDTLVFYRGGNVDAYYKKTLALLFDFADIFNRATLKDDKLCMRVALKHIESHSRIISDFLHLLEVDICRLKDFSSLLLTKGKTP
jgi:hypothetical protein